MAETVSFLIKISDNGTFKKVEVDADSLRGAISKVKEETDKLKGALVNWSQAAQSLSLLKDGFNNIAQAVMGLTEAYGREEVARAKLANNMRNTMAATEADVAAVNRLIDAQKELGVVDDDVQRAGAQELATYLEKRKSLERLIPVMNDMLAQQYGLENSEESAAQIAAMLGKVMEGQTEALSRYGYHFDEAQKQVLKFGEEEERAAVLAEVVESSVGGMNETLAQTDAGKAKKAADEIEDLRKSVGQLISGVQPLLTTASSIVVIAANAAQCATAVRAMTSAFGGLNVVQAITNSGVVRAIRNYVLFGTVSRSTAAANGVLATSLLGVGSAALFAQRAIRAFWVSTGVGIVLVALTEGLNALIDAFTDTGEAAEEMSGKIVSAEESSASVSRVYEQTQSETYSRLMTKYTELKGQWESLTSKHAKTAWIKQNASALKELGLKVESVAGAEKAFADNSEAVADAFLARARAAARAAQLTEEYRLQMELMARIGAADSAAQSRHPKIKAGDRVPEGQHHGEEGGLMEYDKTAGYWRYTEKGAADQNKYKWIANDDQTKADRQALKESKSRSQALEKQVREDAKNSPSPTVFGTSADDKTGKDTEKHLVANAHTYKDLTNNIAYYKQEIEKADVSDTARIKTLLAAKKAAEDSVRAFEDMVAAESMPADMATLEDYDKALQLLRQQRQRASKEEIANKDAEIRKLEDERATMELPVDMNSLDAYDKKLNLLRRQRQNASKEEIAAIDAQIKKLGEEREALDDVAIALLKEEEIKSYAQLETKLAYYNRLLNNGNATQRATAQQGIDRLGKLREAWEAMDKAASKPAGIEKLNSIKDLEAAISYYEEAQGRQSAAELRATEETIAALRGKLEKLRAVADLANSRSALDDLGKLDGKELTIELKEMGLDEIKRKVRSLQKLLKDTTMPEGDKGEIRKQISEWSSYEKRLKKSQITVQGTWQKIEGLGNGISGLTSALEGNGDAWQMITGVINSAIQIYEAVNGIIQIVRTLTAATTAEQVISSTTQQAVNRAESGTWMAVAAAKAAAAYAGIPFVGAGLAFKDVMMFRGMVAAASIPAFASGAVISGPTLGLVGEYANARTNPEVIAPLDKLKSLMGNEGGGEKVIRLEVRGRKLVGVMATETQLSHKSGKRSGIIT